MNKKTITACIAMLVIVAVSIFAVNSIRVQAFLRALGYEPTAAVANIRDDLKLTDEAQKIFNAARPSLKDREEFNNFCNSHDEQVSMLGCYGGGQIYIYDIDNGELAGITESTMAHELLHAVWARMSENEKNEISDYLWAMYQDNEDLLNISLDIYDDTNKLDEIHSRVGTQIKKLPNKLEEHYAKYFKDQDLVVEYYDNYNEKFVSLSERLEDLSSQMTVLSEEIDQKTEEYVSRTNGLVAKIEEFNVCANTKNCFATDAAFNERRRQLIGEQNDLDALYDEIDQKVNEYNDLVDEYNSNVLRTQNLQNSINSNSTPPTV